MVTDKKYAQKETETGCCLFINSKQYRAGIAVGALIQGKGGHESFEPNL